MVTISKGSWNPTVELILPLLRKTAEANDQTRLKATTGWSLEIDLVIARLDKLSRNEDVQQKP